MPFLNIPFTSQKNLIHLFHLVNQGSLNSNKNKREDKKILFIHNPKVAGNTIFKILGLDQAYKGATSHKTPTMLVSKGDWESYVSVVGVRHPIDRLISSYHYHTKETYQGVFLKNYPALHKMSFEEYFEIFRKVPYVIMPQWYYAHHFLSEKSVDFVLRFEDLEQDVRAMAKSLGLDFNGLPHLNSSARKEQAYFDSMSFRERVLDYYKKDFDTFGYTPDFNKY